nr:MAG TPA: nucelotide kinase [Caudoviricetes sp.]
MATWKYTLGSESDFEGVPDWVTVAAKLRPDDDGGKIYAEKWVKGAKWGHHDSDGFYISIAGLEKLFDEMTVVAQREPVESSSWVYYLGTPEMFARMSDKVTRLFENNLTGVITGYPDFDVVFDNDNKYTGELHLYRLIGHRGKPNPVHDNINHPLRYTKGDVECIDAIKAATVGKTGIEAVDVGHVIRYLWRYEEKDGLESVKKAQWYIEHLIKQLESKQ